MPEEVCRRFSFALALIRAKNGMVIPESKVHSFIVKLWQDDDEKGKSNWHGYITHVPDASRRYLQDLSEIISFIEPYLAGGASESAPAPSKPGWLKWARRKRQV
ncbi:MAG TPA: hypothetical protein VGO56_10675 [Pyrinomonadaceae bacterium]|jgi:hypothetical protein|nr:hypothetical protein [Pyrinomonadaceae bacterium]